MTQLGQFGAWRHVVVGASVGVVALAAGTGLIGDGHAEHFDDKQVVVAPAGDTGLAIREIVDIDFAHQSRHGYERHIPNDFGITTEVRAEATDASDELSVVPGSTTTRIRIGDPSVTVTGQHRYTLSYVLPAVDFTTPATGAPPPGDSTASAPSRQLALDVIGTDETLPTDTFEIVVTGFELQDPLCNVGRRGDSGGCELVDEGDVYRAVVARLEPGEGITIGGTIVGSRPVVDVEPPPLPATPKSTRLPVTTGATALGLAAWGAMYTWARRTGRNEVTPGGAADAAYGAPPPPGTWSPVAAAGHTASDQFAPPTAGSAATPPPPFRLVPDDEMNELATIEFVPPTGIDPWVGRVLLNEQVNDRSIQAWVSGHAARDVLTVERDEDEVVTMAKGPEFAEAPGPDQALLERMLGSDGRISLGKYSKSFAQAWSDVRDEQVATIDAAGYWKRPLASGGDFGVGALGAIGVVAALWIVTIVGSTTDRSSTFLDSVWFALGIGLVLPGFVALVVYRRMLPALTTAGSALALRTESFRRFLEASEGQHVEWAWKHGLLREYSAWAVALDTAEAWEHALKGSSVPPTEYVGGPLVVHYAASSFSSTVRAPNQSGGHGGGGFSGGSVGGGGGGGSSGSW